MLASSSWGSEHDEQPAASHQGLGPRDKHANRHGGTSVQVGLGEKPANEQQHMQDNDGKTHDSLDGFMSPDAAHQNFSIRDYHAAAHASSCYTAGEQQSGCVKNLGGLAPSGRLLPPDIDPKASQPAYGHGNLRGTSVQVCLAEQLANEQQHMQDNVGETSNLLMILCPLTRLANA